MHTHYKYSYVAHKRTFITANCESVPKNSLELWQSMRAAAKLEQTVEDIIRAEFPDDRQEFVVRLEKLLIAGWVSVVHGDNWQKDKIHRYDKLNRRLTRKPIRKELRPVGECILYEKLLTPNGYGRIVRNGKTLYAHRVAWEAVNGPIPEGASVLHRCGKSACINVEHLYLGTKSGVPWKASELE